jgi:hypothetical protein
VRTKLVLLAVTALVFAPGWGADPTPHDSGTSELAVRILAPTFDEARSTSQIDRTAHGQQRGKLRTSYGKELVSIPPGTQLHPNGDPWVAVLVAISISVLARSVSDRSTRAPPHLVTI